MFPSSLRSPRLGYLEDSCAVVGHLAVVSSDVGVSEHEEGDLILFTAPCPSIIRQFNRFDERVAVIWKHVVQEVYLAAGEDGEDGGQCGKQTCSSHPTHSVDFQLRSSARKLVANTSAWNPDALIPVLSSRRGEIDHWRMSE